MLLIKPPAPPPTASTARAPQDLQYTPTPKAYVAPEGPEGQEQPPEPNPEAKEFVGGILMVPGRSFVAILATFF